MRITRRAQSGKFRSSSQSRNSIQIQARADGDGASEPVVVDVVDLQCARVAVAQYEIAFAKHTAEVADARKFPNSRPLADDGGAGDLIAVNVVGP